MSTQWVTNGQIEKVLGPWWLEDLTFRESASMEDRVRIANLVLGERGYSARVLECRVVGEFVQWRVIPQEFGL